MIKSSFRLPGTKMDGTMPTPCSEKASFREGENKQVIDGSLPSIADAVAWLRPYVENQ
ncbi:MAG: hypothetical protein JXA21_01015 [Anaerolineae bacterium]|nr:hypothetical protein [Anaerolineae bacterium]